MVADVQKIPMTPFTDEIPENPCCGDDYSQENNLKPVAEKAASVASFAPPATKTTFSPKNVWKKVSDGFSNHQGKIIAITTVVALAVLTHFVGLVGALCIGAICLIFISRR